MNDGVTAACLAAEPAEDNLMKKRPRRLQTPLVTLPLFVQMFSVSLLMAIVAILLFRAYLPTQGLEYARSVALTTLIFFHGIYIVCVRSRLSIFSSQRQSNKALQFSVAVSLLLQLAVLYTPIVRGYFHLQPLRFETLLVCAVSSLTLLVFEELRKASSIFLVNYSRYQAHWSEA